MGSEWKESTLGELVDFTPKRTIKKGSIAPFVAMADLRENHREILCVTEKEYKGGGSRFANGDTLFARITPCLENGKTALAKNLPDGFIAHGSTEFIIMAARLSEYDREFIYYLARHPDFRKFAESRMEGTSGRQRVSWQSLSDYPISLPSPSEQKAIAHILSSLDDKIELNRRMNATLEAMAQALFKSWFVDFDPVIDNALAAGNPIPDEFAPRARLREAHRQAEVRKQALGERSSSCVSSKKDGAGAPSLPGTTQQGSVDHPTLSNSKSLFPAAFQFTEELGWIPEGWEVGCISDLAALNPESWTAKKHPDSVNYVDLANTKDGRINETTTYEFGDAPSRARRVLKQHDTIIGTVRPGNRSFAYIHDDGLTGSTGFAVLRSNDTASRSFIYLALTRDETIEVFAHLADGAAYPAIRPEVVWNTQIPIPSPAVLKFFEDQASSLLAKTGQHQHEAETLSKLRNTLLPHLISGELKVSKSQSPLGV